MKNAYLLLLLLLSPLFVAGQVASVQDGNWNDPNTWDCTCVPAAGSGSVTIVNSVTVSATQSADQVFVDIGGQITVSAGVMFTIVNGTGNDLEFYNDGLDYGYFEIFGTLVCNDLATIVGTDQANTNFRAGSIYRHLYTTTEGSIPVANWASTSRVEINGYTPAGTLNATAGGNWNQDFGDFYFNSPLGSNRVFDFNGLLTSIAGELRVVSTGAGRIQFTTVGSPTINIGTDLSVLGTSRLIFATTGSPIVNVGRDFIFSSTLGTGSQTNSAGAGSTVINIGRDFSMNATGGQLLFSSGTGTGGGVLNISRNFNLTAGTLTETSSSTGAGSINFVANTTHDFVNTGTIANTINFTVQNGSTLNLVGESFVSGGGTFTLQSGATVGVGSANGLVQGTGSGNIRTTNKVFQANGNIIYNGATQNLGNEWVAPGALGGIAVNLQITNGAVVTNNNIGSTSLVGVLTLTNGTLNIGNSNTLTIQGVFNSTASGYIGGGTTSNLSFAGSGAMGTLNFASGANDLNTLTVGRTGTLVLGSDLTVNSINLSFGNLNFSNHTLTVNGASISSAGTGLISNSSSNLVFGGSTFSGSIPFSGMGNQLNNLTFATPGGVFNWNSNVTIQNQVTLSAGTVNHTSGLTMGTGSTLSRSGGSFLLSDPDVVTRFNVEYTGSVTTGLELPATPNELNNLTINSSGTVTLDKDITVNGNVNLLGSTFDANGFDITLASPSGTWTRNGGGFIGGSGILTVTGNYTIVAPSATPNYTNITVNSGASLTFPTGNINISGNVVNNGTINRSTSTTNFNGNTTISGSNNITLNNITVTGTLIAPAATTLGIAGNFINTGTFNHNNGTVAFSGTTTISGANTSNFFHVNLTGTLTAPSATMLGIAGDLTHSGTFNHNNGTVFFNGTVAAQTVSGSSLVLNNLRVSNPVTPGVRINNTTRLNGICTLTAGAFFDADGTGGGFFIVSSSSQIAGGRIAALPNPNNFTGNVTIERYVHGRAGGDYRYLSMPITTNANVGVWRNSMFVTGNFSDRNTHADNANINDAGNMNPSVYTYNSTTNAYDGVSGGGGLTTNTAVSSRIGYSVYDFNDGPVVISYRGVPEKGSVPITISGTAARFNLVPNPYPSPIDWDNVTKTNVTDAMYLRVDNNVFSSYVGGVSTNPPFVGWSGEVAVGQAFFVVSSGSGTTFTLTEASKSNNAFYFLREESPNDYFRIRLNTSNEAQDEVVIRFSDGATDQFDSEFDAPKMWMNDDLFQFNRAKPYANMATYLSSADEAYSINTIDLLKGVKIVHLTVSDIVMGKNTLTFSELNRLTQNYNIVLVDTYLQKEYNVSEGFEYEFTVSDDKASQGSARFHLRINGPPASDVITSNEDDLFAGINVYPNPVVDKLSIELSAELESNLKSIELVSMLGVPVVNSENNKQLLNTGVKTIDMGACARGVYLLTIQVGNRVKSIRILKK